MEKTLTSVEVPNELREGRWQALGTKRLETYDDVRAAYRQRMITELEAVAASGVCIYGGSWCDCALHVRIDELRRAS